MKDSISNQRWTSALWHNAMNFPWTLGARWKQPLVMIPTWQEGRDVNDIQGTIGTRSIGTLSPMLGNTQQPQGVNMDKTISHNFIQSTQPEPVVLVLRFPGHMGKSQELTDEYTGTHLSSQALMQHSPLQCCGVGLIQNIQCILEKEKWFLKMSHLSFSFFIHGARKVGFLA